MKNAVLDCIYNRKSVRNYTDEPVSDDDIKMLIDAGVHAANGLNIQGLRFAVVSDKEKLKDYSDKSKVLFHKTMVEYGINDEHLEKMMTDPNFMVYYGAPTVIYIFAAPNTSTPTEDASLAAANMMLAAESVGLGTCWIGFSCYLTQDQQFCKDVKFEEGMNHCCTLIVGHPQKKLPATPRNPPEIISWLK